MNEMLETRCDLPPEKYPIRIDALHWLTRAVVWSKTVESPINLLPLRKMFGHPVAIRFTFADGEVQETEPY